MSSIRCVLIVAALAAASLLASQGASAADTRPFVATASFMCLQGPTYDGGTDSRVALFETSGARTPRPHPDENCSSYLSRLVSTGKSASGKNEPPFPETSSCDELKFEFLPTPGLWNTEYTNCVNFLVFGFW